MSEYTLEELRGLPTKDRWSEDEALALYESIEGFACVCGVPVPYYVQTREQRVRWSHCVRIARQLFPNDAPTSTLVGFQARVLYGDAETFTTNKPGHLQ